jgi:uncharacterized membrane protein YeiB
MRALSLMLFGAGVVFLTRRAEERGGLGARGIYYRRKLLRYQLLYVVFSVWPFLLIASHIWLRHFRFGLMERGWRSLTYWRRRPMKIVVKEQPQRKLWAPH